METAGYIVIGIVIITVALGFFSTMRFNRKKPMSREEYEKYEDEKKN